MMSLGLKGWGKGVSPFDEGLKLLFYALKVEQLESLSGNCNGPSRVPFSTIVPMLFDHVVREL